MNDSWDERRRAQEDQYFEKANKDALLRLKEKSGEGEPRVRLSPVTGKPMEQMTIMGVAIDRCRESGGVWLDSGELEEIISRSTGSNDAKTWFSSFTKFLRG